MIQERFFYHSFPRRGKLTDLEIDKGCKILESIRDIGLLLNPELIEWRQPNISGKDRVMPVLQTRACFTELNTDELPGHAEKFGHFSLEFDGQTIRTFGAVPVFYVPQHFQNGLDGSAVGAALMSILMDSQALIGRLAAIANYIEKVEKELVLDVGFAEGKLETFTLNKEHTINMLSALGSQITPWNDLNSGVEALKNFFYPTDNSRTDAALEYYRQREWRMACSYNINRGGKIENVFHYPTHNEKQILLNIDPEFFNRVINTDLGPKHTLDQCLIFPGLNNKSVIEMANRIIVPDEAFNRVTEIFSNTIKKPPIVPLSQI